MALQNLKKEELNDLLKEAIILSKLESKYIVRYIEAFFENNNFNIIMELCEGLYLRKFINECK